MNKSYKVIGSYRGSDEEIVNVLEGNKKSCGLVDGVNGDGCDEFQFSLGIDKVIKIGESVGLWKLEDEQLVEIDSCEGWDRFFEEIGGFIIEDEENEEWDD
jgi:hypothetical protein